ncbi:MAG: hypothetical protein K6U74_19065 [Firmicutes bacterium]|nr:hypothetical protein [Bacillota bacterium]
MIVCVILEKLLLGYKSELPYKIVEKAAIGALSPVIANIVIMKLMESFHMGGTKGLLTISFLTFAGILIFASVPFPFLSDIAIEVFKRMFLPAVLCALLFSLTLRLMLELIREIAICIIMVVGICLLLKVFRQG